MKRLVCLFMCCVVAFSLVGCKKFDSNYGKASEQSSEEKPDEYKNIKIPEIKSDDSVMPNFVDISLYDEENYADIYLGEDFEYKLTYCGESIVVPTTYAEFVAKGWQLADTNLYGANSTIQVGRSLEVDFVKVCEEKTVKISAVFYNKGMTLATLEKCPVVEFKIKENVLLKPDSQYAAFGVNGVSNASAITDIVEALGAPSHFYKTAENKYYLDWFITEKDRRSEITIYVDMAEDHIDAIEFSYY